MSEQERMDRAKRIREMREGRRSGDDADEPANGESTDADGTPDETAADTGADDEDADAMAHVDDAVADAVERVTGASASVPSPDEMGESNAADASAEVTADDAEVSTDAAAEADDAAEDATADESAEVGAAARAGIAAGVGASEPETRVLEFSLDDEQYCLDIEYIEEIVKRDQVTRVPNTPAFVEGVVDLRGQITTILNPKVVIGTEDQSRGDLLLVFDADEFEEQGHLGWVVDDVRQVSPVSDDEVNGPPIDDEHVEGVIDRGDDEAFVVWTTPDLALDEAT